MIFDEDIHVGKVEQVFEKTHEDIQQKTHEDKNKSKFKNR